MENRAAFSTDELDRESGQGFAVVHATGSSTNTFRLANRPVQQGERQCSGVGRAAWMRREVQWAMDGRSGPTPERRWRERTRSAAEGRMTGASVFDYFCPGRAAATEKSESPGWAKQETSAEFDERLWHQESRVCCTETLGFASAQPNLQIPPNHPTQKLGTPPAIS